MWYNILECYLHNKGDIYMLKKYKNNIICGTIIGGLICILIPFILDIGLYNLNLYNSHLNSGEWSSFNGSYLGAIIGGIATLIGVLISLGYTDIKNRES
jgi:hypothetical protein